MKNFFIFLFSLLCFNCTIAQIFVDGSEIMYGVNGHPLTQKDYKILGIKNQIALLKMYNFKSYRFDVNLKPVFFEQNIDSLKYLKQQCDINGISLLPVFYTSNLYDIKSTEEENYQKGVNAGILFLKYFPDTKIVEVGNENDSRYKSTIYNLQKQILNKSDAAYPRFTAESNLMRGFIDCIHQKMPQTQTIVDYCFNNYWYLEAITKENVNFDIVGNHFYTNLSLFDSRTKIYNSYEALESFFKLPKPIYITEFNYINAGVGAKNANVLYQYKRVMTESAKIKYVKALYFYELLDQPNLKSSNKSEQKFGVVKYFSTVK